MQIGKLIFLLLLLLGTSPFAISQAPDFETFTFTVSSNIGVDSLEHLKYENEQLYHKTGDENYRCMARYVDIWLIAIKEGNFKRLNALSRIIESGECKHDLHLAYYNFELASLLAVLRLYDLSKDYALTAWFFYQKTGREIGKSQIINLTIGCYYGMNLFPQALKGYRFSLQYTSPKDTLGLASVYNNMGLCYLNMGRYKEAESHFRQSQKLLLKLHKMDERDRTFYNVVIGNLGTVMHESGDPQALDLLEQEVRYNISNPKYWEAAVKPCIELLHMYHNRNDQSNEQRILSTLKKLDEKLDTLENYPLSTQTLFDYYYQRGDSKQIKIFSKRLVTKLSRYTEQTIQRLSVVESTLYRDKLISLKRETERSNLEMERTMRNNRKIKTISILLIITLVIFSISVIVVLRLRNINMAKNAIILEQKRQIEMTRNIVLQTSYQQQQEQIASLAFSLKVKMDMEKVFMDKLKNIKKNTDYQKLINELKVSFTNLLLLDKKMIDASIETDEIHRTFRANLLAKHPELTKSELEFCCYFRLNMTAKEIGAIKGLSAVSVRVMKHKIKQKLKLDAEDSLDLYLSAFSF